MRACLVLIFSLVFLLSCELDGMDDDWLDVVDCLPVLTDNTLDIVTWNLNNFPKSDMALGSVEALIGDLHPDVIALQEVGSVFALSELLERLPGWKGLMHQADGSQLGFIYNSQHVEIQKLEILFGDDTYNFPRPAVMARIVWDQTGEEFIAINIHLKCCNSDEDQAKRRNAAAFLKAYVDDYLPEDKVIILGDYNEDISEREGGCTREFLLDHNSYVFADHGIANGSSEKWSFPGGPLHIDHILVTNELFYRIYDASTLIFEPCFPEYENYVSDHRPVYLSLLK